MNIKNLILLRDYLIALPKDYEGFHMGSFNDDIEDGNLNGNDCGTSACMAGHMVYVKGFPDFKGRDVLDWQSYASLVSGLNAYSDVYKFNFLFSSSWDEYDNTVKGAVFRINYLLDNPNKDYAVDCRDCRDFCIEHKLGEYT
jgi:hypothetical protein